jgi:hypothetical protein
MRISLALFVLILTSCAYVTPREQSAADTYLFGQCKELFLSTRTNLTQSGFGYQYYRYINRVFAVANYENSQFCAFHTGGIQVSHNVLANNAIEACSRRLPDGLRCVTFAIDDQIINIPPRYSKKVNSNEKIPETRIEQKPKELVEKNKTSKMDSFIQHCKNIGLKEGSKDFNLCIKSIQK